MQRRKDRGVSVKVSEDFYKLLEKTRYNLKNQHKINIKSHVELTRLLSKNNKILNNKSWIKAIKNGKI